jgi:ABC-2 type transport system permease protein
MDRLQTILHLGLKEFASLARDAAMVFLIVYAFTYNVYGPAKGAQMELRNASVAIVDEDRSMLSSRLADALIPPFFLPPQPIGIGEIDAAMDRGRFTFVVDIPPRFQADVEAGRHPTVQLNVDATSMSQAGRGTGYIEAIFTREIAAFLGIEPAASPVGLVTRAKFNPNLLDTWFLGVSQLINNITLLAIILSGAALVREREHGTMEHLLVLPLTPADIMLAKVWSNAVVIVAASTLSLEIVVKRLLDVPIAGSVPLFMAGTAIYMFSMTALGIFLATLARSMPQFGLLAFPVFIVLNLLSGGSTPLDSMPRWLQQTMQFSPTTHYVNLAMSVLYRGADFDAVWPDFVAVIAIGAVFFVAALARFRRTVSAIQA